MDFSIAKATNLDPPTFASDVVIIGAGVIGLSIAWRLAQKGMRVVIADPNPLGGASWVAAGMLAPVSEANYGEQNLVGLGLTSLQRYPCFVKELQDFSQMEVGYIPSGTLEVALDINDKAEIEFLHSFRSQLGLETKFLDSTATRKVEPLLAPGVQASVSIEQEHQIDNRLLCKALAKAAYLAGVYFYKASIAKVDLDEKNILKGVVTSKGIKISSPNVVIAAGAWSKDIKGVTPQLPIYPIKGQTLRVRLLEPSVGFQSIIRGLVKGHHVYMVPRKNGEIIIGATVEDKGFDTSITIEGLYELLRNITSLLPSISEAIIEENLSGLRPGSPNNAPILGSFVTKGLFAATGHYRNGILLTPVTSDALSDCVIDQVDPSYIENFSPNRFIKDA